MVPQFILTYLYFLILFYQSINGSPIYVCPVDTKTSSKLIDHRQNMMCNGYEKLCPLKDDFISTLTYQDTVIIIHSGEWPLMNQIAEKLSSCGIPYLTLDTTQNDFDLTSFCSSWQTTLIFSVTNQTKYYFDRWSNVKQCSVKYTNTADQFLSNLIDTCPISIFVTGETTCAFEMLSYSLKLYGKVITTSGGENTTDTSRIVTRELRVGTILYPPFYNYTGSNETKPYEGVVVEMMDKIAKATGFTYSMVLSPGNKAGIFNNGSWDGLIGMLLRKEIDMIAAPLTVTYERSQVVAFSPAYYFESLGIMIKKPDMVPRLWRAFTLFTISLWVVIFIAAIITVVLLYVLHVYAALPTDTGFERMTDCVWYVVACMSNQAHEINPGSWSAQNYLAFWWLYIVAIIAIYGGVLISLLTNKTISLPFTTLSQLTGSLESDDYKVCIQGSTGFHARILSSDAHEHVVLRNWLKKNPQFVSSLDGCTNFLLHTEKVAFLAEVTRLQELQKSHCNEAVLILLDDRFYPGWFSFAYQKTSPLMLMQTQTISEIAESGLVDGWRLKFSNKTTCHITTPQNMNNGDDSGSQGLNMDPLTLSEVGGPFVLLTAGIVIAIVAFVVEKGRTPKAISSQDEGNLFKQAKFDAATNTVIKVKPASNDCAEKVEQEVQRGVYFTY